MDKWKGKNAVVTGASAGIGAAITVALAREGINVIGLARRFEQVEKLAAENASLPGKIIARHCDVSKYEEIKACFEWIREEFGGLHILVNNAGIHITTRILDSGDNFQDLKDMIDTNLTSYVACVKEAFKIMEKQNDLAYIINVNSIAGHQAAFEMNHIMSVYSGTKFGIRAVSDVMRHELVGLKNKKIRVSCISPGHVETEMSFLMGAPADFYEKTPHLKSEDIADIVIYFLSLKPHVHIKDIIIQPVGETR